MTVINKKAIALSILKDEIEGDLLSALSKLHPDYSMTWMYKGKTLFPRETFKNPDEGKKIYEIKGRKYDIKNIAETKNVVFIELVESYPDLKTKRVYRTPLVLVLEFQNGKIRRGRHYCDPKISYLHLTESQIKKAMK